MVSVFCLLPVLLLTKPLTVAGVSEDTCDINALVGDSLTLTLDHKTLSDRDALRWTHNSTAIFNRQSKRVRTGKPTDIDAAGSLLLHHLSFSSAGLYRADAYDDSSTRVNGWNGRVCVMEAVTRPEVSFVCATDGARATLSCGVLGPRDVVFTWAHDGQLLRGETNSTLGVTLAKLKGNFSCSVRNGASQAQSSSVKLKCQPPLPKVYCFKASTVMAAVAGGTGLVLLLLIATIVSCYRRKKETKPDNQAHLLMVPAVRFNKTDNLQDYETMQPSGESPGPSPKPSPRYSHAVYSQDILLSVATAQEGHSTLAPASKQGPSPVPKPRTMASKAAGK